MRSGPVLVAVIVVMTIVVIAAVRWGVRRAHGEGFAATEEENGKTLQDLSTILQTGVNSFFTEVLPSLFFISDEDKTRLPVPANKVPVYNAPFEGTLNNMDLRTWNSKTKQYDYIVEGSGSQTIDVPVIPKFDINYTYRLDSLYDLASQLQISAGTPTIEISDVDSNGNQTILLRLAGHIPSLKGKPTTTATTKVIGIAVHADCSEYMWLKDVYADFTFKFSISGCGTGPRVTSLTLADVVFSVQSVDYRCQMRITNGTSLGTRDMNDDIRGPITKALNSSLKNVLVNLMRDHFSQLNFPLLFCLRVPTGCIPGVIVGDVQSNKLMNKGVLQDLTYNQCKAICNSSDKCMAAYQEWGEASGKKGRCLLYNTDILSNKGKQPLSIPFGDIWIKKSANKSQTEIRHAIPYPDFNPSFVGYTTALNIPDCESVARTNGATAWSHDGGTCYMYAVAKDFQKATGDIFGHCGMNFDTTKRNKFVFT